MYNLAMSIEQDAIRNHLENLKKQMFRIEVEVLDGGKLPFKVRQSDAGFDVYATSDFDLHPGTVVKHPLNIRMKLPKGTWGEITTKSGLGAKGQLVYAGVIDEEYRGIPHVIMTNVNVVTRDSLPRFNTVPISFKKGDKLAQLIMSPYCDQYYIEQVDSVDTATSRGEGGFGSTGTT
jgi:dUTP pyrophosphatase